MHAECACVWRAVVRCAVRGACGIRMLAHSRIRFNNGPVRYIRVQAKRRVCTDAEKRFYKQTRQAKCYFIDVAVTLKVRPGPYEELGPVVGGPVASAGSEASQAEASVPAKAPHSQQEEAALLSPEPLPLPLQQGHEWKAALNADGE